LTAGRSVSVADLTVSTGNITPSTAAKGINFTANTPAAGMTSQLLNWYEEGTWTPALSRSSTAPTVTHTAQVGTYTRVGRLVTITGACTWSANSGGSGNFTVTGLPFANNSLANNYPNAALGDYTGITLAVGTTQLCLEATPGTPVLNFICSGSAVGSTYPSAVAASGGIYFTLTYIV
jgi:hypothetical protein